MYLATWRDGISTTCVEFSGNLHLAKKLTEKQMFI